MIFGHHNLELFIMLLERTLEFVHNGPQGVGIFCRHRLHAQLLNASFQRNDAPHVINDDRTAGVLPYPNDRISPAQRRWIHTRHSVWFVPLVMASYRRFPRVGECKWLAITITSSG